jgi:hypothetical protein
VEREPYLIRRRRFQQRFPPLLHQEPRHVQVPELDRLVDSWTGSRPAPVFAWTDSGSCCTRNRAAAERPNWTASRTGSRPAATVTMT